MSEEEHSGLTAHAPLRMRRDIFCYERYRVAPGDIAGGSGEACHERWEPLACVQRLSDGLSQARERCLCAPIEAAGTSEVAAATGTAQYVGLTAPPGLAPVLLPGRSHAALQ